MKFRHAAAVACFCVLLCAKGVSQSGPTCTLSVNPVKGAPPLTVSASGACNQGTVPLSNMTLDFGDGTTPQTQSDQGKSQDTITGNHTYPNSGNFVVTVTATDEVGASGSATQTVIVNAPPTCSFSVDKNSGPAPLTVNATANCTDPENDINSASIVWGDGTQTNLTCDGSCRPLTTSHTYSRPGFYTADAQATDSVQNFGSSQNETINPQAPPPTCTLVLDKTSGAAPLTVNATGSNCTAGQGGSMNSASIYWGDDTSSSLNCDGSCTPFQGSHTYNNNGTYTVTLSGQDVSGPTGSDTKTVTVGPAAPPPSNGDLYASDSGSSGTVSRYNPADGSLVQSLSTGTSADLEGMAFDQSGNLYVADTFTNEAVYKFDVNGALLGTFGAFATPSSIVFDRAGNAYVGQQNGQIIKTDSSGNVLASYTVAVESSYMDWIALAADQCTIYYTSEGTLVKRFNVCTSTQLSDFASGLSSAEGVRIRPNGEVIVADSTQIVRFSATGQSIATYGSNANAYWYALALAPDGTSFWAGDYNSGSISRFDIATGNVLLNFNGPSGGVGGLEVRGGITVGSNQPPTCSLTVNPSSGTAPLTVTATGNCTDPENDITSTSLNWGDGTVVNGATSGQHTYTTPGSYTVTVSATDVAGSTATASQSVTVTQAVDSTPSCTLSASSNRGLAPFSANFSGTCTDAGNDISSRSRATLNFGDNSTPQVISTANGGNFSNVTHVYQNPGTYTVTYTVTDDSGHTGTASTVITVTQNQPPACTLTLDKNSGTAPLTVNATANCSDPDGENVNSASINWGDGSPSQSLSCEGSCSFQGPHTYTAPGTYMIVVTATDAGGLTGSANQTVTVTAPVDSTPQCTLNSDSQNGAAPFTVTFSGSCQDAGNDLGQGSIGTLNFGDNTAPQQVSPTSFANVSHVYQTPGTYTATFTATDSTQHTGSSSLTITVTTPINSTPMCTLNSDKQTGVAPLTVNFNGSCSDAGNDLIVSSEKIDFGDGTTPQTGTTATHTYAQAGSYNATLSASDSHGNTGSTTQTITVTASQPPACTLSVNPTNGQIPLSVTATGNCTPGSSPIATTTLNFGDGTVQSGTSGSHTYATAGNFTVTVTATDQNGLQGTASQTVSASAPALPPSCTLSVTPASGPTPLSVTATGNCTAGSTPIATTTLDFGDGTTLNASSGTHTYQQAGMFTAKITATDSLGLSGSATQVVTVSASKFPQGVFVGISGGTVMQFAPDGTVLKTLSTGLGGTIADMAFDSAGTLYAVDFTAANVSKFDLNSGTAIGTFGSGYNCQPESMVFDGAGNAYVGQQGCSRNILKLDPSGKLLAQYTVATEEQGSDDVDLSADQCTLLYTSEGPSVLRYDVCRNQQMTPFATGLNKALMLRILPDGGVIVADLADLVHLNSSGQPVMTYTASGERCLYGVALDQDGTSFWTADYCSSNIYRFDIASGKQLSKFNTGTPSGTVFGLAIAGSGLNVAGLGNGGSMTAAPQSATLAVGQSATFTISFTPNASAAGKTLTLSCAGLPTGLSCSFTPATITLGAAETTSTASLTITRTTIAELRHPDSPWMLATWMGGIPAVVLIGLRRPRRRRGSLWGLGLVLFSTGIWASCGGGGMSRSTTPQPTPQGAYTVIVVGTASGAQASTPITLTIQ